jgi:hypothetical protein
MKVRTPLAIMVFNRPDMTARLFEAVRAARPPRLFVVADGPRADRPGEAEACAKVRSIVEQVDWPCAVEQEFSATNLGCKRRMSSGIDWVFGRVEEAIILEDDCIPGESFFAFCDALLERYREDERVMGVTGCNFQFGRPRGTASYHFSRYMHVWGWASWRRAWRHYDVDMAEWPLLREGRWPRDVFGGRVAASGWRHWFDLTHAGRLDTWDYQWLFAILRRGGLVATPNVNLVRNIGAGVGATHPVQKGPLHDQPAGSLDFPLVHPVEVRQDEQADEFFRRFFTPSLRGLLGLAARRLLAVQ